MRYKNVEFRRPNVTDSNGYTPSSQMPAGIAAWLDNDGERKSCYTLCWLREGTEGFHIETIGRRFTEYEDTEALMHVARYALRILDTEKEFKEGSY